MKKLILAALALLVCSYILNAQNESGTRNVYKYGAQRVGLWYDSNTAMYQIKYPIIRSIPPLSTGMPFDVLIGYVYLDSLMRFSRPRQTDSLIKSWNSLNDTLKNAIKYLYKLEDYNPIIFRQYWDEVRNFPVPFGKKFKVEFEDGFTLPNDTISTPQNAGRYRNDMYSLVLYMNEKFSKVLPNQSERAALFSLSEAECIYRVKILTNPDSMYYRHLDIDSNNFRFLVIAEVLDTIKGKVFNNYNTPETRIHDKHLKNITLNSAETNPIIKIQYSSHSYYCIGYNTSMGIVYQYPDSAFLKNSGFPHEFGLKQNQECIVFLSHSSHLMDSTNDYYDFILEQRASGVALPIIDGYVRDVNHIWSDSLYLPYSEWRSRVNYFINKILTGIY